MCVSTTFPSSQTGNFCRSGSCSNGPEAAGPEQVTASWGCAPLGPLPFFSLPSAPEGRPRVCSPRRLPQVPSSRLSAALSRFPVSPLPMRCARPCGLRRRRPHVASSARPAPHPALLQQGPSAPQFRPAAPGGSHQAEPVAKRGAPQHALFRTGVWPCAERSPKPGGAPGRLAADWWSSLSCAGGCRPAPA